MLWNKCTVYTIQSGIHINSRIFRCVSRNLIGVNAENFKTIYRSSTAIRIKANSWNTLLQAHTFRIHRDPRDFEKQFLLNSRFRITLCYTTTLIMSSKLEAKALPCIFNSLSKEYHDSQLMQCETKEDQRWDMRRLLQQC